MASKPPRPRRRDELVREVLEAGRPMSTAAVMFHSAVAAHQGLSATEEKALDLLERFGPLTAGELGARSGLAPASITGLVDRLEKKGFARRIRDEEDRRRVLIELDRSRLASFGPLFVDFVQGLERLLAGYTVEQLETILHFMRESTRIQEEATRRLTGDAEPS